MASIHRDPRNPRGNWQCCYTLPDGRRTMRSTGTKNRAEARVICEAWAEAERAAARGDLSRSRAAEIINETLRRCGQEPVTQLRLGDWLSEWLETKTALKPATRKSYKFACARFLEFLGAGAERRYLETIQERDIRRFAHTLKAEGRTVATINRIIHDLGGAFSRAVQLGKVRHNPFAGIELGKDDSDGAEQRRTFTPGEIAKLVETARGSDWQGLIILAYSSGMRLQDGSNLRWSQIDLEVGVISFRQRKTSRESVIGLHADFAEWLLRRSVPDDPQAHVFPQLAGHRSAGRNGLTSQFNRIVQRAGIDAGSLRKRKGVHGRSRRALSFHSLRHGAASAVFNAAAIKEMARRVTGHAERGSLDRYLHVDLEAIKASTALIPRLPLVK
jgi:integrase